MNFLYANIIILLFTKKTTKSTDAGVNESFYSLFTQRTYFK